VAGGTIKKNDTPAQVGGGTGDVTLKLVLAFYQARG
jgi:hypothetical protein